jgi:hypothetical protein
MLGKNHRNSARPGFLMRLWVITLLGVLPISAGAAEPPENADPKAHWAFQKPVRVEQPPVKDGSWVRNPIDAFILAGLEKAGLKPSPALHRPALLRRVTFDLTGLPPTPRELEDFLGDARPDAYSRVVDRLLASPHYGERWATHWLDVVRYAESDGYEADAQRAHAWRYRDYVVRSFNEDKPYNRFLTEQIAGDLLAKAVLRTGVQGSDKPEAAWLVAAGFNRCGPVHLTSGNLDQVVGRNEVLTEMTNGVGAAFLGLTLACARCHDHKFDPVSTADYYRMQAFFASAFPKEISLATPEEKAAHDRRFQELTVQMTPLRNRLANLDEPYREKLSAAKKAKLEPAYRQALETEPAKRTVQQIKLAADALILIKVTWDEIVDALSPADRERRQALRKQLHDLEARLPPPAAHAWTIADNGTAPVSHILKRGDPLKPGKQVDPAFPNILTRKSGDPTSTSTGGQSPARTTLDRLELARWLTEPDHPLTARVIVNRLWQHHFGRGIVATPNDFGLHGQRPTHPELLDWLATELVRQRWSLKQLHRLMVLSNTYQQDSRAVGQGRQVDPDNKLLWRTNRRRLEAEALRDNVLAVAGTLNPALGGPMVRVPLEPEVYELIFTEGEPDGLWHATPDPAQHTRRSLYLFVKRNVRLPMLEAFDQPDTLTSCPVRPISTFAPQALILINGPLFQQQAQAFACRLLRETAGQGSDRKKVLELGYRLALARQPQPQELEIAQRFLAEQADLLQDRLRLRLHVNVPLDTPGEVDPALAAALADFCLALFNRNEFLYIR